MFKAPSLSRGHTKSARRSGDVREHDVASLKFAEYHGACSESYGTRINFDNAMHTSITGSQGLGQRLR
jgi:hypothetical protein